MKIAIKGKTGKLFLALREQAKLYSNMTVAKWLKILHASPQAREFLAQEVEGKVRK